jgi:hypothetical protein
MPDEHSIEDIQETITEQKMPEVPASEFGRVRALATYGMTIRQVAALYGVDAQSIKHIVSKKNYDRK